MRAESRRPCAAMGLSLALCASPLGADPVVDLVEARCRPDGRLIPAAVAALDERSLGAETLRGLAHAAQLPTPVVRALVVPRADPGAVVDAVARFLDRGVGVEAAPRCAMAVNDSSVSLVEAPASVDSGLGPFRSLLPASTPPLPFGATSPRCVGTTDEGRTVELPCSIAPGDERPSAPASVHTLQLVATLGGSPVPLGWWRLRDTPRLLDDTAPTDLYALLAAVNALRARDGLARLRVDPLLRATAQDHAEYLQRLGLVTHRGNDGSLPPERLARRGVRVDASAENVARAPSVAVAHTRLLDSPSHRANLLHPAFDAVGLGLAAGPTGVTLVELFGRRPTLTGPR